MDYMVGIAKGIKQTLQQYGPPHLNYRIKRLKHPGHVHEGRLIIRVDYQVDDLVVHAPPLTRATIYLGSEHVLVEPDPSSNSPGGYEATFEYADPRLLEQLVGWLHRHMKALDLYSEDDS